MVYCETYSLFQSGDIFFSSYSSNNHGFVFFMVVLITNSGVQRKHTQYKSVKIIVRFSHFVFVLETNKHNCKDKWLGVFFLYKAFMLLSLLRKKNNTY